MRSRYKFDKEYGAYFITSSLVELVPVFTQESYFQIILNAFQYCRENKGLKIHYYVIMDNHIHAIISGENLSNTIQSFKRHTAKKIISKLENDNKIWLLEIFQNYKKKHKIESDHQIWQEGVHPQKIEEDVVLEQKINYIHFNPVKRGLVKSPEDWIYSSASNFCDYESVFEVDEIKLW